MEPSVLVTPAVQVPCELLVVAAGQDALLVEKRQHSRVFHINEIQNVLVVGERDEFPQDTLPFVFLLLNLEHILVELLLQSLVRVVDTELLKVVHLERLKAENVQHTNRRCASSVAVCVVDNTGIHALHDKVERGTVDRLD